MRKRHHVLSVLTAAMMLSAFPAVPYADAGAEIKWILPTPCYDTKGELYYDNITTIAPYNSMTLPSEYDGLPVRRVDPMKFIHKWVSANSDMSQLTVYLPEGMKLTEKTIDDREEDKYLSDCWPENFKAKFILSDGTEYNYYSTYQKDYVDGDNVDDWEYEIIENEKGREYVKLLKYHGNADIITLPEQIDDREVIAVGKNLLGDENQMMKVILEIPESITQFDDDCFGGLYSAEIKYGDCRYYLMHDDDPETSDYLMLCSVYIRGFDEYYNEHHVGYRMDYDELGVEYAEKYLIGENAKPLCESIGNYPVRTASDEGWNSVYCDFVPLPDSIRFIKSGVFSNRSFTYLKLPKELEILPSDFIYAPSSIKRLDGMENVKYMPRDVYGDIEYDGDESLFPADRMLPEGVTFEDPFAGFHITDENGRTYRIMMSKKDFNYYAHLIYEPHEIGDIPETFMGYPVIDERSSTLYASAGYVTIPEDMKELSIMDFVYDPVDFPQFNERLDSDSYDTYESAVQAKMNYRPLAEVKKVDILSKDIKIAADTFNGSKITELSFPGNADIGTTAFGNTFIKNISFTGENSEIKLGRNAFTHSPIESIVFPDKVKEFYADSNALAGMNVEEITLPDNTVYLGTDCLANCTKLKKLTVNGSPQIMDYVFANCTDLVDATFSGKPTFGSHPFTNCKALKNLNIDPDCINDGGMLVDCVNLETINGEAIFDKDGVPNPKLLDMIERTMKDQGNNKISDKYTMYRVKKTVRETITDDMTDMEKLKALHDKVCSMVEYDNGDMLDFKNHTDISVFLNDTSVCEGYSRALNLLLNEAGIESCYVENPDHSWNIVKLGDHYFHVDSTWDDGPKAGYSWFLKTDDEIRPDSSHASWKMQKPSDLHDLQWEEMPVCSEKMGDVNNDGVVDGIDASAVLASYARASAGDKPTVDGIIGDVNFNGRVDAVDASAILRSYADASV